MSRADQTSGSELVAKGDQYASVSNQTSTPKTGKGRVCRVLLSSGTGAITIYDNTSETGTPLWASTGTAIAAVGGAVELDCPFLTGLTIVVAATTVFTVIYA